VGCGLTTKENLISHLKMGLLISVRTKGSKDSRICGDVELLLLWQFRKRSQQISFIDFISVFQ